MPRRLRLDAELVRRGLADSREQATRLIAAGRVAVGGRPARKPATGVTTDAAIVVSPRQEAEEYASRAGHKLAGALDVFADRGLSVQGRLALDAGASTGGFTDVLLRRGAARVIAVDVGYGQLLWRLSSDPRVTVLDRTNVRNLAADQLPYRPDLVVADLSFISLTIVLPALVAVATEGADLLVMVKPQFEAGRDVVDRGSGVVRDPVERAHAIVQVGAAAAKVGFGVVDLCPSPLPGPAGNVEYFLWLRAGAGAIDESRVASVVADGPQ